MQQHSLDMKQATSQPHFQGPSRNETILSTADRNSPSAPSQSNAMASGVPTAVTTALYVSHFLSTWNSRSFEFGAVLFLAAMFPDTLLYMSIYGLVRAASAIVFASAIGRAIDRKGRLVVMRFSIVVQRAAVILSCVGFYCVLKYLAGSNAGNMSMLGGLIVLACLEKICSVMNLVSVERDWVVVIAGSDETTLRTLNARMRRIDLICKLAGPLFISLIDGASTKVAVLLTLGINVASLPIEYFAIAKVYSRLPALQAAKTGFTAENMPLISKVFRVLSLSWMKTLLYFTVLSFGGQMVTYLLAAGYNSFYIALVRTLSVVFEISATWIAPRVMARIGATRAGMWFLSWQMLWLGAAVSFFWGEQVPIIAASGLSAATILSRIGLWGYDLCAQLIIQEEVQSSNRGLFSSTEAAFQNAFELLAYVVTIAFSRPTQFRYPVLISAAAVYTAGALYSRFLRQRRGHLVHVPACIKDHDGDGDDDHPAGEEGRTPQLNPSPADQCLQQSATSQLMQAAESGPPR